MSRLVEYDDYDGGCPNPWDLWQANARRALSGKRGRKALAELREALMALPGHRLIEGALCTVGAPARRDKLSTWAYEPENFDADVERQGEGVCAIGAYLWWRKVQDGADPAAAFDELPTLYGTEDGDSLHETAMLGRDAGLTRVLAYELAYRNDEHFQALTPEQRHARFIEWIDEQLAAA